VKHKLASVENEISAASNCLGESSTNESTGAGGAQAKVSSSVHQDCSEVTSVEVFCRGGYGICPGIVIPTSTPEGMYALRVRDGTSDLCRSLQDSRPTSAGDPKPALETDGPIDTDRLPGEMGKLYKFIPAFPSSRLLLIQVAAKPA
jgi:hypothetical protein